MSWKIWVACTALVSTLRAADNDPLLLDSWLDDGLYTAVATGHPSPAWTLRLDHILSGDPQAGVTHHRSALTMTFEAVPTDQWFVRFQALDTLFWSPDVRLDTSEDYRSEWRAHDVWAQYSGDHLSLKLGKQNVVWGAVEGGEVVDVITPLDRRDFLVADLSGMRQTQWMAVLSAYEYPSSWQAFITVEPTFDIYPDVTTEPQTDIWEWGVKSQFALGDSVEWAGQLAHLVPNSPLDMAPVPYYLLAMSAVMTKKSWLWKADLGVRIGEKNTFHGALGMEAYWQQQTVTAFVSYHDTVPAMALMNVQWRKSYWYDAILGSVMLTGTANLDSMLWASQLTYRVNDRVEVLAGWLVVLLSEDQAMVGYSQGSQQLMLKLSYQF